MKKKLWIVGAILLGLALVAGVTVYFAKIRPEQQKAKAQQEAIIRYRQEKLSLYRQENDKYKDFEVDLAFLGDSLTDGYDVTASYPQFLVTNRGIGGDTTFDLEARLPVSVYDLKPKAAVMLIGANNLDTMFDNYENILIGLQKHLPKTKIVLLSLTSMGRDWAKGNPQAIENNVKIKALAEQYGFTFVDLYNPLLNPETGEIYPQYTTDGGHLTAEGYEVLTGQITPVLETVLSEKR